jgi:hypothetical protein
MAESNIKFATAANITCTLTSLADGGYRESAAIDNTSNLYMDAHVGGSIQVGAVTADGIIEVYAYGSWDGTDYSGGLAGTDETITWGTTPSSSSVEGFNQLKLIGILSVDTTDDNNDIEFGPFAVAPAFGGHLPRKWGIVIKNSTGIALHATGTNNSLKYSGITYTSV